MIRKQCLLLTIAGLGGLIAAGCSKKNEPSKAEVANAGLSSAAAVVSTGGSTGSTGLPSDPLGATACGACEKSNNVCADFRPCDSFGAAVDSKGRLKGDTCRDVLACIVRTGCAGVGVEGDCYCGNASGAACDAGNGSGACRAEIERGADSTSPGVIQSTFTKTINGGGKALARVVCLNGSTCANACSVLRHANH